MRARSILSFLWKNNLFLENAEVLNSDHPNLFFLLFWFSLLIGQTGHLPDLIVRDISSCHTLLPARGSPLPLSSCFPLRAVKKQGWKAVWQKPGGVGSCSFLALICLNQFWHKWAESSMGQAGEQLRKS